MIKIGDPMIPFLSQIEKIFYPSMSFLYVYAQAIYDTRVLSLTHPDFNGWMFGDEIPNRKNDSPNY